MKTKQDFLNDLSKFYNFIEKQNKERSKFYQKNLKEIDKTKSNLIEKFLTKNNLKINEKSKFAIATKFVTLKNDAFIQFLNEEKIDEKKQEKLILNLYNHVSNYYLEEFDKQINYCIENNLFSKFYIEILKGVKNVGIEMNKLFIEWKKHIIYNINKQLIKEFKTNDKVFEFLEKENLFDLGHNQKQADRSYSALIKINGKYTSKPYCEIFKKEITQIISKLNEFKNTLQSLNDEIYNQKQEYINYIDSIINAFSEKDTNKLVLKWADVDKTWMKITTPFQIGHPLEYYDDHFRKAVQIEWDLRIINPKFAENKRVEKIKLMYLQLFNKLNGDKTIYQKSLDNLNRVQLYLGRPALYFGSNLNGLFSAQVVPNDMIVSEKYGKKIFAFADLILENLRQKPQMKLPKIIFEESFVNKMRNFILNETSKWHQVYDIETIGHEYGHILWLDETTEIEMNKTGNFKNIEEFKATTGGLVSFFLDENKENLKEEVLLNHIQRSVNLIAWKKISEVEPYYCEGLIHLNGLFETEILKFEDNKLKININEKTYKKIKKWYLETYQKLAKTYLNKESADNFLFEFAKREENYFMPTKSQIKNFVNFYYKMYEKYANVLEEEEKK